MTRPADCCGHCGTQLQPLDPSTMWARIALEEATRAGMKPGPLGLALIAHVAVIHDELEQLPPLVPFNPTRGKRT